MLAPTCLWPVGLDTFGLHVAKNLRRGRPLDVQTRLVLQLLSVPPSPEVRAVIAQYEAATRMHSKSGFVRARHKFSVVQEERRKSEELASEWNQIKAAFNVAKYRDSSGMIYEEFVQDQDPRMNLHRDWNGERTRFRTAFRNFCHRWNLRGMRGDIPVLLNVGVHLTPFGTVIFLPAYWSLDHQRDFWWQRIKALHRTRSLAKQGLKLSRNQSERRKEADRAKRLMAQAVALGLKGSRRDDWVMRKLNWDMRTEPRALRRLLKEAL
ncbi:MAG: hypothetical protein IT578_06010 [Verrucomicrobiae bacterium]|nr:hypothetical protein [Verrucomicrobiae bacterium]